MLSCDRHLTESWEVTQLPNYITNDARLSHDERPVYQWSFVQRDDTGKAMLTINVADLSTTWRRRLLDGSLGLEWQEIPRAFHVSAKISPPLGAGASLTVPSDSDGKGSPVRFTYPPAGSSGGCHHPSNNQ
jgi:hypothetical protein